MSEQFSRFTAAEKHALEKAIFIESQKQQHDLRYDENGKPTNAFFLQWIEDHAVEFKKAWETSNCKNCKYVYSCYDCLKDSCDSFKDIA